MEIANVPVFVPDELLKLPDDILGAIFFSSGYISPYWKCLLDLLCVNKRLRLLGRDAILRVSTEANRRVDAHWLCVTMPKMLANLGALKLDYTFAEEGEFPCNLGQALAPMADALTHLSCRGTSLGDEALLTIAQHLPRLTFIDVSKSQRALSALITDRGGSAIASSLTRLKWLNLSMTRITDATIASIAKTLPQLRHLGLDCCTLLTDECFDSLEIMRLETLDVSSCDKLTNDAFFKLGNRKSQCRATLKHLLMSYLPLTTFDIITFLLAFFDNLTMLEMKARTGLGEGAPPMDRRLAAQAKLKKAIFVHGDEGRGEPVGLYMSHVLRSIE